MAGGGAGGNGGLFGNYTKGGTGGPAKIWMRARAPIPPQFTAMGTLILPTLKLNIGVAQTDSMTAAGQWRTIAPGEAAGGYMLIIRANSGFTDYVYLWIWDVSGVTHYELGRVASGVKSAWKTGTVGAAIPFNAFTLTSDAARTFTVGVNGTAFDSYNDSGATSLMGARPTAAAAGHPRTRRCPARCPSSRSWTPAPPPASSRAPSRPHKAPTAPQPTWTWPLPGLRSL